MYYGRDYVALEFPRRCSCRAISVGFSQMGGGVVGSGSANKLQI